MTAKDVISFLRTRRGTAMSVALHLLVVGWGLFSYSARSVVAPPEELVPVDIISEDNSSKAKFGSMDGKKEHPKPLVDKIGEKKPTDDIVGKVDPKPVTETDAAPTPQQAEAPQPEPPKHKSERKFDLEKIAAAINQKDPTRQAAAGAELNANAALGTSHGTADANVASWSNAFASAVARCFSFPYNGLDADKYNVDVDIQMRPDGTVAATPRIGAVNGPSRSVAQALAENAARAVESCQPYSFLPKDRYASWKVIYTNFNLEMMNSIRGRN